jgi:type IV pilus assembly protein PilM
MLSVLKKKVGAIGVDLGSSYLRMAQLGSLGKGLYLHAVSSAKKPDDIEAGTGAWQRWAAAESKKIVKRCGFKGKKVVTALPSEDVFINQLKIPKMPEDKIADAVFEKVKQNLPFDANQAMLKYVIAETMGSKGTEMDVLVMATDKLKVERHLAIYEKAGLDIQSISVWPFAMTNSFVEFFSRRSEEKDTVAMLMDVGTNNTNIVICRYKDLLFARVIPMGFSSFGAEGMVERLMSEVDACSRYFESVSGGTRVQRLIFLAGHNVEPALCEKIADFAQKMQIPAQLGDVLTAVEIKDGCESNLDRQDSHIDWATSFGLSLSVMEN